jgi:ribonuclease BN (tRNA processing enzyme)
MKIKVLGCAGAEFPGYRPSSFLLNGRILFDTGNLTNVLDVKGQLKIEYVFLTHSHLDHILGIPFLADNLIYEKKWHPVNIISIPPVIKAIKKNLLDGSIWPDFSIIPNIHEAILNLQELKPNHAIQIDNYLITPYRVNHSVPAAGYLVEDHKKRRFFYTGDTGPSEATWKQIRGRQIHCLIIEASFPNRMEKIALQTGHLTPRLLKKEISKIDPMPETIYITHLKPLYSKVVKKELERLNIKNLKLLKDGQTIKV